MSTAGRTLARGLAPVSGFLNRALGRSGEVVWMIGDGRSGSSWVADMLARTCNYRQLFEPFHPFKVRNFTGYALNQYQRPGSRNDALKAGLAHVFAGRISNRRVNQDANRLLYDGLVVKDVFATLLAAWGLEQFPEVKPLLQIRNPFAVALSKAKRPNWLWTSGPAELLEQPALVEDHLAPHADFLRDVESVGDPILNHVAVWAVIHHCLFRDLDARRLHILVYQRALAEPAEEMSRVLAFLGHDSVDAKLRPELLERAARYSDDANVSVVRRNRDQSWTEELTSEQVRRGNEVLARFGLDRLHDGTEPAKDFECIAASLWRGRDRA